MQYLVEGTRGPLPPSPEQAIALLEGVVIPAFEYLSRLKAEGKVLAGGLPVGDRAFVCIIEAASNDEADRIVREMPTWGVLEWKVTPLQSFEARAEMERKVVGAEVRAPLIAQLTEGRPKAPFNLIYCPVLVTHLDREGRELVIRGNA